MMKYKIKNLFLIVFVIFAASSNIFGDDNKKKTIEVESYFPAPFGEYKVLRLVPRNDIDITDSCNLGTMFVEQDSSLLYVCQDYGEPSGEWGILHATWAQIKNDSDPSNIYYTLYPSASASDPTINMNVGLGTITPTYKLHLDNDGGIIAMGKYNNGIDMPTTSLGEGTRLIWYPKKGASRVGGVEEVDSVSDFWDDEYIGDYSFASGRNTIAGNNTLDKNIQTALGDSTIASGEASTAIGQYSKATGDYATAFGLGEGTSAYLGAEGNGSLLFGEKGKAKGDYSVLISESSESNAYASFILGNPDGYSNGTNGNWTGGDEPVFTLQSYTPISEASPACTPASFPAYCDEVPAFTILQNGNVGIQIDKPLCALDIARFGYVFCGGRPQAPTNSNTPGMWLGANEDFLGAGELLEFSDIIFDKNGLINTENDLYIIANSDNSGDDGIYFGYGKYNANSTEMVQLNTGTEGKGYLSIGNVPSWGPAGTYPHYPIDIFKGANPLDIILHRRAYCDAYGQFLDLSTITIKDNVSPLSFKEATETLSNLCPVVYNFKKSRNKNNKYVGFIAEDVPEAVATVGRKTLTATPIVSVLTKVVQKNQHQIEEQEDLLKQQEEFIQKLEEKVNNL